MSGSTAAVLLGHAGPWTGRGGGGEDGPRPLSVRGPHPENTAETVGTGPDPEKHMAAVRKFADASFDHICLPGVGSDQAGFIAFSEKR